MAQAVAELSDAHCHLNLFDDPKAAVADAMAHGMKVILATGGSGKDNLQVSELTAEEIVFGIVGIAPDFAHSDARSVSSLHALVKANKKIVGIGEIGLDFKIAKTPSDIDVQREVFERQLALAGELELPVVIHSRGGFDEIMRLLDKHKMKRVMFHFFEGNGSDAIEVEKRGYIISVPPVENSKRREAIRAIDVKNIVVETDSPVVGKTPLDVKRSLEMISKIKDIGVEELAQTTTDTLREFFYI